jgi:hypothetical protein
MATEKSSSSPADGSASPRSDPYVKRYALAAAAATLVSGGVTGLFWWLGPMSLTVVFGAVTVLCAAVLLWMSYDLRGVPPPSSPNLEEGGSTPTTAQPYPADERELDADRNMARAEYAVSQGGGTELQRRRVRMMRRARTHESRRSTWLLGEPRRR